MKNTDIALIILIAVISVVISYFLGNMILGDPADLTSEMIYVDPISSGLEQPKIEDFNSNMRNPTVEVIVGECPDDQKWDQELKECVDKDEDDDDGGGGGDEPEYPDVPVGD